MKAVAFVCMLLGSELLANAAATPARADLIVVGAPYSNVGNCIPFGCNASGTPTGQSIEYQQVYSSSSFPNPVKIDSLTFYDNQTPGGYVLNGSYTINLSTTTASVNALSLTLDNNIGADNALFFSGTLGRQSIAFTITGTAFLYNPARGNLLMDIIATNQATAFLGSNDRDGTGILTSRAYSVNGTSNNDSIGLVTGFGVSAVPEPAPLGLVAVALASLNMIRRAAHRRQKP